MKNLRILHESARCSQHGWLSFHPLRLLDRIPVSSGYLRLRWPHNPTRGAYTYTFEAHHWTNGAKAEPGGLAQSPSSSSFESSFLKVGPKA